MAAGLPKVQVFSLGGTIASVGEAGAGAVPRLSARDLVAAVPQLASVADVSTESFRQLPSPDLTIGDVVELAQAILGCIESGVHGVVVTQGTDTLEETAFLLDLLLTCEEPVVVTGAMRNPSLPGADGPANLFAAVQVAASAEARGLGTLVVFNDEIHAARFVQKTHTTNVATFRSPMAGPIGWVSEGRIRIALRPVGRYHIAVAPGMPLAPVALVTLSLGDDGKLLDAVEELGYRGLVLEALGGGHVPRILVGRLEALARIMPVILASRTGSGEVLRKTYGFPGSEADLLSRGLIPAGWLHARKARLLLALLLTSGADRGAVVEVFERIGAPGADAIFPQRR